jgi:LytS/YehU family sensor histidine kinase
VPNLVLQPLVENAVRYAIAPRSAPGRIRIVAARAGDALRLSVIDDGLGAPPHPGRAGAGLGLPTTRARLGRLYGPAGQLELTPVPEGRGTMAIVTLPYRTGESR